MNANIAMVGGHGSEHDVHIFADVLDLHPGIKPKLDLVDLRLGRDFLRESKKYDMVILNYIFVATPEECRGDRFYDPASPTTKVSPLHTPENWSNRLLNTGAHTIHIFGYSSQSEITPTFIGDLPGYQLETITNPNGSIWTYKKEAA